MSFASPPRQADSNSLRTWEVAGTSPVDFQTFEFRRELFMRDDLPSPDLAGCSRPAPVGSPLPMC